MAQMIILSKAWCDEHFDACWFAFDEGTGITTHIDDYTQAKQDLTDHGYTYIGHRAGTFRYTRRAWALTTLPLDWQMALDADRQDADPFVEQDW
jgi:hypothetical protein